MVEIQEFHSLGDLRGRVILVLVDDERPSRVFRRLIEGWASADDRDLIEVLMFVRESRHLAIHDRLDPEDYPTVIGWDAQAAEETWRRAGYDRACEWLERKVYGP